MTDIKGVRTYTDEKGAFCMTTISEEESNRRKEEKLNYELGWKCDNCHERKKEILKSTQDKKLLCKSCYENIWDERNSDGHIIYNTSCPFCNKSLSIANENGDCDCGAIYDGGFLDEFYYGYTFYKRK